jgi:hypothetical protein
MTEVIDVVDFVGLIEAFASKHDNQLVFRIV